jgi:hypothetical protein
MARRSKRKKRKPNARTNAAGRRLLESVREAHRAVMTGNYAGLTVRHVEIAAFERF